MSMGKFFKDGVLKNPVFSAGLMVTHCLAEFVPKVRFFPASVKRRISALRLMPKLIYKNSIMYTPHNKAGTYI